MRAALIMKQGTPVAPNVVVRAGEPDPVPGAGEAVVRTEAAGLNHLDLWVGRGVPGMSLTYPRISGSDGCGVVEAVGPGVDDAWIGRRVMLNAAVGPSGRPHPDAAGAPDLRIIGEHDAGCMAERFVAPARNLAPIGAGIDAVEAAAFGLAHLTAWGMIVTGARLVPGQTVLITGIGGGVALAALSLCTHFGATTIVTSRHRRKLDRAVELGADHAVLDTGEDFSGAVHDLTRGRGVDVCVDSIGRAVLSSCLKALATGGALVTCGCTSGPEATINLARIFWLRQRLIGSTMGDMDEFRQVVALLESGALRPVIDSVHDAADAAAAYARLESGEQFGKVVVRWR